MNPETVMSANMPRTTSAHVTDIKRKVYSFKESLSVVSTTTDSGGVDTIEDLHNKFIQS